MVDILHRVGVEAALPAVYRAVASTAGLAGWWTQDVTGESRVGGILTFRFGPEGKNRMRVVELSEDRRVEWECVEGPAEWIGTRLSFELNASDGESVVLFAQRGWKEPVEFMHACSTKWGIFLLSLKALVETDTGTPYPNDPKASRWF
jgi:hypothetical protein